MILRRGVLDGQKLNEIPTRIGSSLNIVRSSSSLPRFILQPATSAVDYIIGIRYNVALSTAS